MSRRISDERLREILQWCCAGTSSTGWSILSPSGAELKALAEELTDARQQIAALENQLRTAELRPTGDAAGSMGDAPHHRRWAVYDEQR